MSASTETYISSDDEDVNSEEEEEEEGEIDELLEDLFNRAKQPGDFAGGGDLPLEFVLPGIKVEGISDLIALPLAEFQAKEIIKIASKCPFGRKEETLYDDKVRKSWQLNPSQFQITNPRWQEYLNKLLEEKVKINLGLIGKNISCTLYKMLLYEKGGHFAAHRDTEKEAGMFGTLVIQLPCGYSGGEMVVSLRDREYNFSYEDTLFNAHYMCFYSDCKHEIKEITEGYRICLVYNLVNRGNGEIAVQDQGPLFRSLRRIVNNWEQNDHVPMRMYVLNHKYSKAELGMSGLKGQDVVAAELLKRASEEDLIEARLGILEKHETGDGESVEEVHLDLIYSTSIDESAEETFDVMNADISEEMIFPKERFEDLSVHKEEIEEDTGNEGATADRWYRTAVLVFWPKAKAHRLLTTQKRGKSAVEALASMIEKGNPESVDLAQTVLLTGYPTPALLTCICKLNNKDLLQQYFARSTGIGLAAEEAAALEEACQKFDSDIIAPYLLKIFTSSQVTLHAYYSISRSEETPEQFAAKLQPYPHLYQVFIHGVFKILMEALLSQIPPAVESASPFLLILYALKMETQVTEMIQAVIKSSLDYKISFIRSLVTKRKSLVAGDRLLRSFAESLVKLIEAELLKPEPEIDWSLNVTIPCTCPECGMVQTFLHDKAKVGYSFRAKEEIRKHVQRTVQAIAPTVTFNTIRNGTPLTLELTKQSTALVKRSERKQKLMETVRMLCEVLKITVPKVAATSLRQQNTAPTLPASTSRTFPTNLPQPKRPRW